MAEPEVYTETGWPVVQAVNAQIARAAGWVPLAEVLAALQDHDGFRTWALATDRAGYLDEYAASDSVIGDFLAERFRAGQAGET